MVLMLQNVGDLRRARHANQYRHELDRRAVESTKILGIGVVTLCKFHGQRLGVDVRVRGAILLCSQMVRTVSCTGT